MDTAGNEVIPCKYRVTIGFHVGMAAVGMDSNYNKKFKYGFVNKTGKEIVPLIYDAVGNFSDGLAWVRIDDKYGYVDTTGTLVTPIKFDIVNNFKNGTASIKLDGFYSRINQKGEYIDGARGQVILYTDETPSVPIRVTMNGVTKRIERAYHGLENDLPCHHPIGATFELPLGEYGFGAEEYKVWNWDGKGKVEETKCYHHLLSKKRSY